MMNIHRTERQEEIDESRRGFLAATFLGLAYVGGGVAVCVGQNIDGSPFDAHAQTRDEEKIMKLSEELNVSYREAQEILETKADKSEQAARITALLFSAAGAVVAEESFQKYQIKLE